ncbi:dihydropteroate synthase [Limibacter armeniacum]|uniref:dihydropteroate synthase n=1 Tax=Limibacter armeniacum TaxID=466084 RepID=UPI002FE5E183
MGNFTEFTVKKTFNLRGRLWEIDRPQVMGILNLTPDSFYDGGQHNHEDKAMLKAESMLEAGADILDIGGYSSRPGAENVSEAEELERILPVVAAIKKKHPNAIISIDTFRAEVAKKSIGAGADIINDISGGTLDANMLKTVADLQVPYILMHMRGTPETMQQDTAYKNLVEEVLDFFVEQSNKFYELGGKDLILDPGFGFAKTTEQNYELMDHLPELKVLNLPLLVGISRKSMIYKKLGIIPQEALNGTTVLNTKAVMKGADILRVHDVKEAVEVVKLLGYHTA